MCSWLDGVWGSIRQQFSILCNDIVLCGDSRNSIDMMSGENNFYFYFFILANLFQPVEPDIFMNKLNTNTDLILDQSVNTK